MPRRKDYIESPKHWKNMYTNVSFNGTWRSVDKLPIECIKIDRSLFSYDNKEDTTQVLDILANFDQKLWIPLLVNEQFFLLDGQHRLAVAKQLCLKYVDVIIQSNSAECQGTIPTIDQLRVIL